MTEFTLSEQCSRTIEHPGYTRRYCHIGFEPISSNARTPTQIRTETRKELLLRQLRRPFRHRGK